MVEKEGVDPEKIIYKNLNLRSEDLAYSREDMVKGVEFLSRGVLERKDQYLIQSLSRLQAVGVKAAVFPQWKAFAGGVFSSAMHDHRPPSKLLQVVKMWSPLSDLVLKGSPEQQLCVGGEQVTLRNAGDFVAVVNGREELQVDRFALKRISQRKKNVIGGLSKIVKKSGGAF